MTLMGGQTSAVVHDTDMSTVCDVDMTVSLVLDLMMTVSLSNSHKPT